MTIQVCETSRFYNIQRVWDIPFKSKSTDCIFLGVRRGLCRRETPGVSAKVSLVPGP